MWDYCYCDEGYFGGDCSSSRSNLWYPSNPLGLIFLIFSCVGTKRYTAIVGNMMVSRRFMLSVSDVTFVKEHYRILDQMDQLVIGTVHTKKSVGSYDSFMHSEKTRQQFGLPLGAAAAGHVGALFCSRVPSYGQAYCIKLLFIQSTCCPTCLYLFVVKFPYLHSTQKWRSALSTCTEMEYYVEHM